MPNWHLILLVSFIFIGCCERSSAASALRSNNVGDVDDRIHFPSTDDASLATSQVDVDPPIGSFRTQRNEQLDQRQAATIRSESTLNLTPISSDKKSVNAAAAAPSSTSASDVMKIGVAGIAEPKFSKNAADGSAPTVLEHTFHRNCTGEYSFKCVFFSTSNCFWVKFTYRFIQLCFCLLSQFIFFSFVLCLFLFQSSLRLSDGTRRAETAEFEERDGIQTLIIRGLYSYVNKEVRIFKSFVVCQFVLWADFVSLDFPSSCRLISFVVMFLFQGELKLHLYVFDHTGYHTVNLDDTIAAGGVTDFRPDAGGGECDSSIGGNYCIDQKLLNILVG